MIAYRVTFDRIGRNKSVSPVDFKCRNADDLAKKIYKYVRPHLASRDVDIAIDPDEGSGHIICGFHNGGTFTFERV